MRPNDKLLTAREFAKKHGFDFPKLNLFILRENACRRMGRDKQHGEPLYWRSELGFAAIAAGFYMPQCGVDEEITPVDSIPTNYMHPAEDE